VLLILSVVIHKNAHPPRIGGPNRWRSVCAESLCHLFQFSARRFTVRFVIASGQESLTYIADHCTSLRLYFRSASSSSGVVWGPSICLPRNCSPFAIGHNFKSERGAENVTDESISVHYLNTRAYAILHRTNCKMLSSKILRKIVHTVPIKKYGIISFLKGICFSLKIRGLGFDFKLVFIKRLKYFKH